MRELLSIFSLHHHNLPHKHAYALVLNVVVLPQLQHHNKEYGLKYNLPAKEISRVYILCNLFSYFEVSCGQLVVVNEGTPEAYIGFKYARRHT